MSGRAPRLISNDLTLNTNRLILRYPSLNDVTAIFRAISSPRFPDKLPLKEMRSESEIEAWIKRLQAAWAEGRVFSWILVDRDSEQVVGQATLAMVEGDHRWALAFWTHPDHWGNGYATEAAERLLKFGFEDLDANIIWAGAGLWNVGSIRVLEKLGMQYRGENPQGYYSNGAYILTREYEITRAYWISFYRNSFNPNR